MGRKEQDTTERLHLTCMVEQKDIALLACSANYNLLLNNHRQKNVQLSSIAQSHPTLCDPMNRSTPGLPVHHQLLEFIQTHVHRVSDAIQPLIPCGPLLLLPPIPPSFRIFSNESTLHMRRVQITSIENRYHYKWFVLLIELHKSARTLSPLLS